ncbi:sorting nexin-5-like, partial [Argonauta hians]
RRTINKVSSLLATCIMKPLDENDGVSKEEEENSISRYSSETPRFNVNVVVAVKDGETLKFTIKSQKEKALEAILLQRIYEDFEWLHHCLTTHNDISGLIVPPLPLKPEVDAKSAETKSKRQLGSESNLVIGDEFQRECQRIEKYLQLMLSHEVFQNDQYLSRFLSESEPPTRVKLRKGILHKLSNAVDEVRKGNHKDIDDYFQKTRDWANNYSTLMKDTSDNYNQMMCSQYRLAGFYCHFSTTLKQTGLYKDIETIKTNRIMACLSLCLDDYKNEIEVLCNNEEESLGFVFELYARYMDSVKEMLFRRTCLLVGFENANRMVDKAKPPKRQLAEENRENACKAFEDCSKVAQNELKFFIKQRLILLQEGLHTFAESQIKTARDTYALLAKHLRVVKEID